jgi:hypothetical protein
MSTKIVDNFVWLIVTNKAREIYIYGLFELFILNDDNTETLVEGLGQLVSAINNGLQIGIEVGHININQDEDI